MLGDKMKAMTVKPLTMKSLARSFQILSFGLLTLVAGCASTPDSKIQRPLTAIPKASPSALENNGAIFQAGSSQPRPGMALFEDRRARYVGDILTVNLVERASFTRKSETTDERKANASLNIPQVTVGNTPLFGSSWEPASSGKQELKDNETNTNSVTGSITVTVVEILGNGNLVVAGEKQVTVNNDTEYIRLAGVVNPSQISASNTISSTLLGDVQIESKNAQSIDRTQVSSMMARFFLTLLPF